MCSVSRRIVAGLLAAATALAGTAGTVGGDTPGGLIVDTPGDAAAVALANALADAGEVRLLATTCCHSHPAAPPLLDAINTWYRRPNLPVGAWRGVEVRWHVFDKFVAPSVAQLDSDLTDPNRVAAALDVCREVLADAPDDSVTIVAAEALSNLQMLLWAEPKLVRRKVARLVAVVGDWPEGRGSDLASHGRWGPCNRFVLGHWPTPVTLIGRGIGRRLDIGGRLDKAPADHPLRKVFEGVRKVGGKAGRSLGAPAVLAAAPAGQKHFKTIARGRPRPDLATGETEWQEKPDDPRLSYVVFRSDPRQLTRAIEDYLARKPRGGPVKAATPAEVKPPAPPTLELTAEEVAARLRPAKPAKIIFDTDIGSDVDDVGAAAMLNALADAGEAEILAVMVSNSGLWGPGCLDAINTWYGRGDVPVGAWKGQPIGEPSRYQRRIAEDFPNDVKTLAGARDAIALYREVLAAQPDGSVTIVTVGTLLNVYALHRAAPELVARKVRLLSVMGGRYPTSGRGAEANFAKPRKIAHATAHVVRGWPTPMLFSGWEIGQSIRTGQTLAEQHPADSPVRRAYKLFFGKPGRNRQSWDQTAVLAAVRGPAPYWDVVSEGHNHVRADGGNAWRKTPDDPRHHYLVEKMKPAEVAEIIEGLMARRPGKRR